ncbi:hypothetical protein SSX86_004052 [Deinandra increscens subsp. villosa]|uniref:Uncharacterized protein n=1 Tax=Deinandra increscens subsp. villosa TaxID=3103831 RepID=A0AAP0DMI8_9ASTR
MLMPTTPYANFEMGDLARFWAYLTIDGGSARVAEAERTGHRRGEGRACRSPEGRGGGPAGHRRERGRVCRSPEGTGEGVQVAGGREGRVCRSPEGTGEVVQFAGGERGGRVGHRRGEGEDLQVAGGREGRVCRSPEGTREQSDKKQGNLFEDEYFDYSPRGQWLRAAVLGASDGLVYVACLMTGVGAAKDVKAKFLLGLFNLLAGAISIAVREYVSVYSQLDVELAQMKRDKRMVRDQEEQAKRTLPNPLRVGITAAIAFSSGGVTPLLVGSFILDRGVRLGAVVASASVALVGFGWVWSIIGGTPVGNVVEARVDTRLKRIDSQVFLYKCYKMDGYVVDLPMPYGKVVNQATTIIIGDRTTFEGISDIQIPRQYFSFAPHKPLKDKCNTNALLTDYLCHIESNSTVMKRKDNNLLKMMVIDLRLNMIPKRGSYCYGYQTENEIIANVTTISNVISQDPVSININKHTNRYCVNTTLSDGFSSLPVVFFDDAMRQVLGVDCEVLVVREGYTDSKKVPEPMQALIVKEQNLQLHLPLKR